MWVIIILASQHSCLIYAIFTSIKEITFDDCFLKMSISNLINVLRVRLCFKKTFWGVKNDSLITANSASSHLVCPDQQSQVCTHSDRSIPSISHSERIRMRAWEPRLVVLQCTVNLWHGWQNKVGVPEDVFIRKTKTQNRSMNFNCQTYVYDSHCFLPVSQSPECSSFLFILLIVYFFIYSLT